MKETNIQSQWIVIKLGGIIVFLHFSCDMIGRIVQNYLAKLL